MLQSMRSQRVRYDLASHHHHHQQHHQVGISTKVRPVTQVGSWRSLAAVLGKRVSVLPHHDYALELLGKVFFLGKKKKSLIPTPHSRPTESYMVSWFDTWALYIFKVFLYLAALGLSCGIQDLHCIMQYLSLRCTNSLVAVCGLTCSQHVGS